MPVAEVRQAPEVQEHEPELGRLERLGRPEFVLDFPP